MRSLNVFIFIRKIFSILFFNHTNNADANTNANNDKNNINIDETIDKTYRLCRKNALICEDLINSFKKIEKNIEMNKSSSSHSQHDQYLPLNYMDAVEMIDGLTKISDILKSNINLNDNDNKEIINNIVKENINIISHKCNITSTSSIGNIYNSETDIVISTDNTNATPQLKKGTIVNIISQGYLKDEKEIIKKAKVVVSI